MTPPFPKTHGKSRTTPLSFVEPISLEHGGRLHTTEEHRLSIIGTCSATTKVRERGTYPNTPSYQCYTERQGPVEVVCPGHTLQRGHTVCRGLKINNKIKSYSTFYYERALVILRMSVTKESFPPRQNPILGPFCKLFIVSSPYQSLSLYSSIYLEFSAPDTTCQHITNFQALFQMLPLQRRLMTS